VEVEYVEPSLEELGVAADEEFSKIFARFALPPPPTAAGEEEPSTADHLMTEAAADAVSKRTTDKPEWLQDESDLESAGSDNYYDEEDGEGQQRPVSKKKLKRMARYTVAQLKALVKKPECVEVSPRFLIAFYSTTDAFIFFDESGSM
jgi:splicing factor 3B subunit 2